MNEKSLEKINEINSQMDSDNNESNIFEIVESLDTKQRVLLKRSGNWDTNNPVYIVDENNNLHAMVHADVFLNFLKIHKEILRENMELKLAKSIWQNMPIDFGDVWVVAMQELQKITKNQNGLKSFEIDLDNILKNIKKQHPNLFLDIKDFIKVNFGGLND